MGRIILKNFPPLSSLFECLMVFKLLKLPETEEINSFFLRIGSFDEIQKISPPPRIQLLQTQENLLKCSSFCQKNKFSLENQKLVDKT